MFATPASHNPINRLGNRATSKNRTREDFNHDSAGAGGAFLFADNIAPVGAGIVYGDLDGLGGGLVAVNRLALATAITNTQTNRMRWPRC